MTQALRERAFGLLGQLCPDLPNDSLRVTSHALLGLVDDGDTDALMQLRDALPWTASLVELEGDKSPEYVARLLASRGALRSLTCGYVAGRLEASPASAGRVVALKELAALDQRLARLANDSPSVIRTAMMDDVTLLVAAMEVMADDPDALPLVRSAISAPSPDVGPLKILAALETSWNGIRDASISDRSRRFELSAVDHLRQHGFLVAVRAALALPEIDDEGLHAFAVFREDPPLEQLTRALIAARGQVMAHFRGMVPLSALNVWVEYLRGPCSDIAESRGVTLREGTSFAHFCFHVMNFCDLASLCGEATHDDLRRSLMDIEDELKEFALMGQSAGVSDHRANLHTFDATRWKRHGAAVLAADRVARLSGAWRLGAEPAPMGSPSRMGGDLGDDARQAVLDADSQFPGAAHLVGAALPYVHLSGAQWCERIAPNAVFATLALCISAARDAGVETQRPWRLDLGGLGEWTQTLLECQIFEKWLTHVALTQAMVSRDDSTVRVEVDGDVRVTFQPSPALQAALTLLATGVGPAHQSYLEQLVNDLLGIDNFEVHAVALM